MSLLAAIRVALAALLINKGRSALTSLGIVIGISAVIAMVSAGYGAQRMLDAQLDNIGKTMILVRAGGRTQQGAQADFQPLTKADAEAIRKRVGPLLTGVAECQFTHRVVATPDRQWRTVLVGTVPVIEQVRRWKLEQGRFFTEEETRNQAPVCLLGKTVRDKLFPDHKVNPVGQFVRIDRLQVRVIGVLGEKGRAVTGADQDDQVFAPITTVQRKVAGEDRIGMIITAAKSEHDIEKAKEKIDAAMREQHRIKRGDNPDYDISAVSEMAQLGFFLTDVMQMLTAVIASISLLVGGIGIMNIMLASVTERTREIGIRMAVGATAFDVLVQFLIEAVVLSLVGGILGITFGILGVVALAYVAGWPVVFSIKVMALALLVPVAIGVFFGYYPALKASRMDPIEALRYE